MEMMDAMAAKLLLDSLPPFKIAAFPDLMASAEILAMTSGRASKMIRRTPMGQVMRDKVRLSSRRVFAVVLLTIDCQYMKAPHRMHQLKLEKFDILGSSSSTTSRIP